MARVLLVSPPAPWPRPAPLLGIGYLAARLLAAGHAVELMDLGAPFGPEPAALAVRIDAWQPHLVGVTLYTEAALAGYRMVATLRRGAACWVAGGPHATAVPEEPLEWGFDLVVRGEGEDSLAELAARVDAGARTPWEVGAGVAGVSLRDPGGVAFDNPARQRAPDLDRLPAPYHAAGLVDRSWYQGQREGPLPVGLLTSRGCPGRCIFCANSVSGRTQRHHGVRRVLAELRAARLAEGPLAPLSFFDESFTTPRDRTLELCAAMERELQPLPVWWCESRVEGFDGALAQGLAAAGCRAVVFGVESGDPALRRAMGKPLSEEQVLSALRAAQGAGLRTTVCTMLGFPGEDVASLGRTARFLERIAPSTDSFAPLGVVIPLPGTVLYDRHAADYGHQSWWLDGSRLSVLHGPLAAGIPTDAAGWERQRGELEEAALAAGFYRPSATVKAAIRDCLAIRRG